MIQAAFFVQENRDLTIDAIYGKVARAMMSATAS